MPALSFKIRSSIALRSRSGPSSEVFAVVSNNVKDVVESRCGRLLLEPLKELKTRYTVPIHGDDFTIENGRAKFQFGNGLSDRRKFCF